MDPSPDPAWPDDAVEVGVVVDAYGVKGWIRVQPHAADPKALFSTKRWFLKPARGARPRAAASPSVPPVPAVLKIVHAKEHGSTVVAQVREIDDRDAAEALQGARVFVSRQSFPTAGDDEYYWVDLIGLAVVNRDGDALGSVVGLIDNGPQSVLRVAPEAADGDERLIPFVAAYVDSVDLAARRIVVDWRLDY